MSDTKPNQEAAKGHYTVELSEGSFRFNKPGTSQLDRYFGQAQKSLVKAGLQFTSELAVAEDRDAWARALAAKPGLITPVVTRIMEDMGFLEEAG